MSVKRISIILIAIMITNCLYGCGNKSDSSISKANTVEAKTEELSSVTESSSDDEVSEPVSESYTQELNDKHKTKAENNGEESLSGLVKHTDRDKEGYYIEDYISVSFSGYEHDSEAEISVDWDKLANDLGNGITPEILQKYFRLRLRNVKQHTDKTDDLANGDRVNLVIEERELQNDFKQNYVDELKYIDENLWYYSKTTVIVSGLKTK